MRYLLALTFVLVKLLDGEKPPAMQAFERARNSLKSGALRYTVLEGADQATALTYQARIAANGDTILEEHGDPEGWTRFEVDESTHQMIGVSKLPFFSMINAEGYWQWQATTSSVRLWKKPTEGWSLFYHDPRSLGTTPLGSDVSTLADPIPGGADDTTQITTWSEARSGETVTVTGKFASGARIEWQINPRRGWNAEIIQFFSGDQSAPVAECHVELKEHRGGVWFPSRCTHFVDRAIVRTVIVDSAEFDKSSNPVRFTGADLGLEMGFSIAPQDFSTQSRRPLYWVGDRIVEAEEWTRMRRKGQNPGPTVAKELKGEMSPLYTEEQRDMVLKSRLSRAMSSLDRRFQTPWELYVASFIKKHALDPDQTQKAGLILKECQAKATVYVQRNQAEFESLRAASTATQPSMPISKQEARSRELIAPIDAIFERELKPKLDGLLTRAQRDVVGIAPSSRNSSTRKEKSP